MWHSATFLIRGIEGRTAPPRGYKYKVTFCIYDSLRPRIVKVIILVIYAVKPKWISEYKSVRFSGVSVLKDSHLCD